MSSTTTDGRGLFLVLEGVEGAGKSHHLRRLSRRLARLGVAHIAVREPGGTPAGERAREVVLDRNLQMAPETELLLYLAARAEFVRGLVLPALDRGELVLSDRYELSTFAYQGIARGLGLERVRRLNEFATGGLRPDATFLLTLDPEAGRARKRTRADRIELEKPGFHRRVAEAYARLAAADPSIVEISTEAPIARVEARLWDELAARWPDRFPPDGREGTR